MRPPRRPPRSREGAGATGRRCYLSPACRAIPRRRAHGTGLETGLQRRARLRTAPIWRPPCAQGLATLPAGLVPRVLLISDGNENLGSVTRAIWQAQQRGVPIDVIPLAGRPRPSLVLESVSMPTQVFSGERFPVDITLDFAARRAGHRRNHRRGQAAGRQPREPERRHESISRARQRQRHRRDRVGRAHQRAI